MAQNISFAWFWHALCSFVDIETPNKYSASILILRHLFFISYRRKSALPKYDPPYAKRQMLKGYSHPNSPHPSQHLTPDHTFDDAGKLGGLGGFPPYRPVEYVLFCLSFAILSVALVSVAVLSLAILSGTHLDGITSADAASKCGATAKASQTTWTELQVDS